MKRTTISLSDGIAAALAREARRRNRSASEIAREALAKHLGLDADAPRALPFARLGDSGHTTTGRDMESLLEREWHDDARSR
ncbi:MAG: ribbon-helix-helix protein, CopG family [Actinomycetota bacterium]|nr:ribbon-helix-helix protein, CopG family [Actinomycetota bacterium]